MEESMSLPAAIQEAFPGRRQDIRQYSPLTLAYVGDAVYDLIIRTVLVSRANRPVNALHHSAIKYVSAGAQARIMAALMDRQIRRNSMSTERNLRLHSVMI